MPDPTADADAIVAELVAVGLLTVGHDAEGNETWSLTAEGVQVARQLAMSAPDDALAMLIPARGAGMR